MMVLSHWVFSTRCSSWIMKRLVATAEEAAKRLEAQAKLGQDFSQAAEMGSPLQHVVGEVIEHGSLRWLYATRTLLWRGGRNRDG